ncbi:MAG TPA: Nif11 family protein [Candidatus Wallbacteria bacterium]|nr:Nif11 family protein [Candidatus Wallbacteria bacterium]
MSKDNVKKMFGKMNKEAELQKKYTAIMQEHQKEAEKNLADKLVEFGKTSGFSFSKDDLIAARAELMDKANSNKELSDTDLANVAGGGSQKATAVMVSIFSAGIACAIVSASEEHLHSGGCGQKMSTTAAC